MNKFLTIAVVGAVALATTFAATAPSQAFFPKYGFAAGVVGFMVGAAVATAAEHDYRDGYYGGPGWDEHIQNCEAAYGWRYDPHTNLVHKYGDVFECHI